MIGIEEHMENCIEAGMFKCGFCRRKLPKSEYKDHMIAHSVSQKQVENANLQRIVEINDFFEEEKLDFSTNAPKMKP